MKALRLLTAACFVFSIPAWADNPFEAFKGKIKPGLYEYNMEMDMGQIPGAPPGMAKHGTTFRQCVTPQDIDKGRMGRGPRDQGGEDCSVKNFRMSGNSASYTMVCKGATEMTADNTITFTSDGYKMDSKMALSENGRPMRMAQHVESRYLGACSK